MRNNILAAICLMVAIGVNQAYGCDLCSIYRSMEAKTSKPGISLGKFEQFTHFGTMQMDGKEVGNQIGQKLDSSITQFIPGYQFNDTFGVQLTIPYISRLFKRHAFRS